MGILESSRGRRVSARGAEQWTSWGQYVAVIAAYGAAYQVIYNLSVSHWELTVGFRLCCLLLVPIRLWPALAFGEFLPVIENALICFDRFGLGWTVGASVPQIVLCMALMKPMRQRWSLREPDGRVRMSYVISAALACALMSTVRDTTALYAALAIKDYGPDVTLAMGFGAYLLAGFLGALTLVPSMLAIQDRMRGIGPSFAAFLRSPLLKDACVFLAPTLALLAWYANGADEENKQLARLAMMLPVALMAWRHGWHGTAIAGMAASIFMALTSHAMRDPAMIYCQIALAFCISFGLMMGGRARPAPHPVVTRAP